MTEQSPQHGWLYRRLVQPILSLLRMGATPERLAWSIAAGIMIGINPILGSTTLVCFAAVFLFRLNVVASQLANHMMYPLQIALMIPFMQLGSRLFHTEPLPLAPHALLHDARTYPIALVQHLWMWEWHAIVVWLGIALIGTPLIALVLTPLLRRTLVRLRRHEIEV